MIDPKKKAEMDQGLAMLLEFYPPQWRQMYLRLIEEGFSEPQSMELLKTYVMAIHQKG